jgi:N-acyl amino acid synthase FeeM
MSSVASLALSAIERGRELLNSVDYRLIETAEDREQIYRLRYRAYIQEGAVEPRADQRLTDRFDDLPNTWIFGIYSEGVLASSIRVSVATPEHPTSPSVDAFPDVLQPSLAKGKVIVDPTRFVADPLRARSARELPYLTVRLGYVACAHFNADLGLATVRADHAAFYRRVFLQEMITPPRRPPGMTKSFCVMAADYRAVRERIYRRYPYFHSTLFERRMLFERRHAAEAAPSMQPEPAAAGLSSVRLAAKP